MLKFTKTNRLKLCLEYFQKTLTTKTQSNNPNELGVIYKHYSKQVLRKFQMGNMQTQNVIKRISCYKNKREILKSR